MESKIAVVHGGNFVAMTCMADNGEREYALLFKTVINCTSTKTKKAEAERENEFSSIASC